MILYQDGIDATTRSTIFKQANISAEDSAAVLNLGNLGITLQTVRQNIIFKCDHYLCLTIVMTHFIPPLAVRAQSNQKAKGLRIKPEQMEKYAERAREVELELMRFLPLLQETMYDLVHGKLSTSGMIMNARSHTSDRPSVSLHL
jgi:hypothetical protein